MTAVSSNTTLRPPWLGLARAAWIALAASLLLLSVINFKDQMGLTLYSCAGKATCPGLMSLEDVETAAKMGLSPGFMIWIGLISSLIARWSLALMGVIIFWKRSDDWLALMLSAALLSSLVEGNTIPAVLQSPLDILVVVIFIVGTVLYMPVPFIFPNGRFIPRWTRWAVFLITPLTVIAIFPSRFSWLLSVTMLIWTLLAIYAVIYRYRRESNPTERQQIKWVGIGFLFAFISAIIWSSSLYFFPVGSPSQGRVIFLLLNVLTYPLGYGGLAACLGIAILRYRLWDFDLLIRRTLVYTVLTGLLALVFFGAVALLQSLFTTMTGQNSAVAVVISTLMIAALANPLRLRIQNFIDKRFYRQRYNAERIVEAFAARLRDEIDLEDLEQHLLAVVEETLQPSSASLWIKPVASRRQGLPLE